MEHPFALKAAVADPTLEAIFEVLTKGAKEVQANRIADYLHWAKRAEELDDQERELFRKAPKEVQACWSGRGSSGDALAGPWRGKRTLLLEEMAAEAGVPNPHADRPVHPGWRPDRRRGAGVRALPGAPSRAVEVARGRAQGSQVVQAGAQAGLASLPYPGR